MVRSTHLGGLALESVEALANMTAEQEVDFKAVYADFHNRKQTIINDNTLTARQRSQALNAWRAELKTAVDNVLN